LGAIEIAAIATAFFTGLTAFFLWRQSKPKIAVVVNSAVKSIHWWGERPIIPENVASIDFEFDVTFINDGGKRTTVWDISLEAPSESKGIEKMSPTTTGSRIFGPDAEHITEDIILDPGDSFRCKLLFERRFARDPHSPSTLMKDNKVTLRFTDSKKKRHRIRIRPETKKYPPE
jgi:hypothetical protein